MSFPASELEAPWKRRATTRACDACRRRKVRCNGRSRVKATCSNCTISHMECTYTDSGGSFRAHKSYTDSLETRIRALESIIKRNCPYLDIEKELEAYSTQSTKTQLPSMDGQLGSSSAMFQGHHAYRQADSADTSEDEEDRPDKDDPRATASYLDRWLQDARRNPAFPRLIGKSGLYSLMHLAFKLYYEYHGNYEESIIPIMRLSQRRPDIWDMNPPEARDLRAQRDIPQTQHFEFPDEDLWPVLVGAYFEQVNVYCPLLHRPTFEAELASGLHFCDRSFAAVFLAVCALGAQFAKDPRVFMKTKGSASTPGWKWFIQASRTGLSSWDTPFLYDLQLYVLIPKYLIHTTATQTCWMIVGTGLRLAQDIGIHRKKVYGTSLTVQDELWKRAFWSLVEMDRSLSWHFGRSCSLQDEDFDAEMPVECDDSFWGGPTPFLQPAGKPSEISFFTCLLRLNQTVGVMLRTIYAVNKRKAALGALGQRKLSDIVAQLDSAMHRWLETVPNHLQWDPHRENDVFFNQSATLYARYYAIQINIHRVFLDSSPRADDDQSLPSLAVCANAARSLSNILGAQQQRTKQPLPQQLHAAFFAGLVLVIAAYGGKRSGLHLHTEKELANVHRCIEVLKILESSFPVAGRARDMLTELVSINGMPMATTTRTKRGRDEETDQLAYDAFAAMHLSQGSSPGAAYSTQLQNAMELQFSQPGRTTSRHSPLADASHHGTSSTVQPNQTLLNAAAINATSFVAPTESLQLSLALPANATSIQHPYPHLTPGPSASAYNIGHELQELLTGTSTAPPPIVRNADTLPDWAPMFDFLLHKPDASAHDRSNLPAAHDVASTDWGWFLDAMSGYPTSQAQIPHQDTVTSAEPEFALLEGNFFDYMQSWTG